MRTASRTSGLVLLLLLLVSCGRADPAASGGDTPSPSPPSPVSYDGTWELVEGYAPEGPIEITERWRITLTIDGRKFGGLSACNYYGLSAEVEGSTISIGGVGGTEMGCHPKVVDTEARYHSALMAAETISRIDDHLVIAGADSKLVFGSVPPPPTRELTDVRWELQSLIHGHGPDARVTPAHRDNPAYVYFDSDGSYESSTGCREFVGKWIVEHDRITFTRIGAKDVLDTDCPDELLEQNDAIIGLGDGFTLEIEGRTLTVYGRFSDTGLEFRAAS